ncbi:MAG TPA: hypothetical protein VGC60_15430 [Pyrinomonadaceae bacterium]|jgi:hypothetical protein
MSDRKYRQRGYMDHGGQQEQRPRPQTKPQAKPQEREGPRSPKMMAFGQKVKCAACGATVQANIATDSCCPKCNADLHTCRQCTSFDPGAHFECRKPITAKIANKGARNDCELFAARTIVERETSSGKPTDAKQAFANLFKK